jgi:hypothetical protein
VVAVAAIESSGALAGFSNYGATTVDIGAPGVQIISTAPQGEYVSMNGTSMAAPHVTGSLALLRSLAPGATAASLRDLLLMRAEPTGSLVNRTVTGGRLDLSDFAVPTHGSFTDPALVPGLHTIRAVHVTELRTRIDALRQLHGLAAMAWTDPVLDSTVSVKAVHFTQMRSALIAAYQAAGRTPPSFADPVLSAGVTLIRAAHITDLRAAVEALEE